MTASDRLPWKEKLPLGLALLAQSYVVGLWYYRSIAGAHWTLDLVVAVAAGVALDAIVVSTVMGRRAGRESVWSWATSLGAFVCSSLIALDRYGWELRSGLHIAFPLVVFLYSQHLASGRQAVAQAAQDAPGLTETPDPIEDTPQAVERLVLVEPSAYTCPHCSGALGSKQALGAAKTNGYCPACKAERKAA